MKLYNCIFYSIFTFLEIIVITTNVKLILNIDLYSNFKVSDLCIIIPFIVITLVTFILKISGHSISENNVSNLINKVLSYIALFLFIISAIIFEIKSSNLERGSNLYLKLMDQSTVSLLPLFMIELHRL